MEHIEVTHRPLATLKPSRARGDWYTARCSCGWDMVCDDTDDAANWISKHLDRMAARVKAFSEAGPLPAVKVGDRVTVVEWLEGHGYPITIKGRITEVHETGLLVLHDRKSFLGGQQFSSTRNAVTVSITKGK